tara:strand:+ start:435 stop:632 length:198 start_codon:yes stop_codon:yes gene_type:complete
MAIKRITRKEVTILQRNIKEIENVVDNLEQLVESDSDLVSRNLNDLWSIRNDLIDLEFKLVRYMP